VIPSCLGTPYRSFLCSQNGQTAYVDQDLAARNSRVQNPRASVFAVSGSPTKSQAARLGTVRASEEGGGVNQAEQDTARITWRSTMLALDTEVGSVVSFSDPDVPGGTMNFRVQSMRINADWSVDLVGKDGHRQHVRSDGGAEAGGCPAGAVPYGDATGC